MAKRNWYGLFSHTGQELECLERLLNRKVTKAVTNNLTYQGTLDCERIAKASDINSWLIQNVAPGSVVTLNGYMRILPREVLQHFEKHQVCALNIHPAPIKSYPELKGKDPQERLYQGVREGKYTCVGVVIHVVDEGVDTGTILLEHTYPVTRNTSQATIDMLLRTAGICAWAKILRSSVYLGCSNELLGAGI